MRHLNKLASVFCGAALGLMSLTGCEGGDLYNVGSPDWLADAIAEANANKGEEVLEGMMEDVYTIGNTDYSSGWWQAFSKYYVVPDGQKWNAQFLLNIKPDDQVYYHNFAMIICNDADRGSAEYKEYGAIRFDLTGDSVVYNSQWGSDFYKLPFKFAMSTSMQDPNADETGLQKLAGAVTITVDRSDASKFYVKYTNGTVTRTYEQPYPLGNLNADVSNTNIRCFIVPEGSFINFLSTNIEPIGGLTSAEDKQPISMTIKGAPKKVLLGTDLATAMANVTAEVQFEQEVTKTVTAADVIIQAVPDMNTLGKKTLVVVYNKTYKGENCATPIVATIEFEVVDKMYTCIGAADNSDPFWGAHSDNIKVGPNETFVTTFTNYTNGGSNWNNFLVVLCKADNSEYAVLRADNYGWGDGYGTCTPSGGQSDWAAWLAAMDGAKVTTYVTNNGNGTADVKAVMEGTDGNTYVQEYNGVSVSDPNDFYFRFTVDGCHLEFDNVIGAEDNSTAFWNAHSQMFKVPAGQTYTTRIKNFTSGASNWNNFVVVLTRADNSEYAVVRADNYGWGDCYGACTPSGGQADWAAWLAAMDEAMVTVSVTNNGGSTDVHCVMVGNDGNTYVQDYMGIGPIDGSDLFFRFTVDNSHLVFE
jgi:hypothetical protein